MRVTPGERAGDRDPERGETVQGAGDIRGGDGSDERADPQRAMHPQAEDGREQQDERCDDRQQVCPRLLGNGE